MEASVIGVSLLWALCALAAAWYMGIVIMKITYVTLADGRKQERRLPIMFKMVLPLAPNVTPFLRKAAFTRTREDASRKLVSAGFDAVLEVDEYLSLRILLPLVFGIPWILFVRTMADMGQSKILFALQPSLYLIGLLWLYIYPILWLRAAIAARHRSIQRALPFVLDLLTLSVEAGMDFMSALQRHVERSVVDPLCEELIRVTREIQIGKTRREALRDMANRVNLQELRSVVSALVQADELGVSIGSMLRIQSDQIRQRRFERAERLANQAPIKLLAPLFLCFLAVLVIMLGPILHRVLTKVL